MPVQPNLPAPLAMPSAAPARKVVAATAGAGVGGVFASLIVWALGAYVFAGGVPDAVSAFVLIVAPVVLSFVSGYVTKRSAAELPPAPVIEPAPVIDQPNPPVAVAKKAAAKKAAAKRPAKKAAPKTPTD